MFNNKNRKNMAKNNEQECPTINLLSAGTEIKGEVISKGDIRIDGNLIGSLISKGKVVIGTSGRVEGEIECQNGDFSGTIEAKVNVQSLLSLKSTANLKGDISTNKLSIEPGAKFSGTCNMEGGEFNKPLKQAELKHEPAKA